MNCIINIVQTQNSYCLPHSRVHVCHVCVCVCAVCEHRVSVMKMKMTIIFLFVQMKIKMTITMTIKQHFRHICILCNNTHSTAATHTSTFQSTSHLIRPALRFIHQSKYLNRAAIPERNTLISHKHHTP